MSDTPKHGRPHRDASDPWNAPITVAQIPAAGLHRVIQPNAEQAAALAAAGGLSDLSDIRAEFTLTPLRGEQIRVEGRVTGWVVQTCVVTLDPLEIAVDERIELLFAPPDQVRRLAVLMDEADEDAAERPDPPEPIDDNGVIDLGRVASDALFLGLDPYPRKPDAVFEPPATENDPEDHPFAALSVLKSET